MKINGCVQRGEESGRGTDVNRWEGWRYSNETRG